MKPVLLSLVGRKGAGKSEVLEALIALLKEKGLRIGVMKHLAREDFEIDQPGKDTYRYRMQGAETVMLLGRKRRAIFSDFPVESDWEENLKIFEGFDLVFLEGYFLKAIPMVEVYKQGAGDPLLAKMENVFAVCSDIPTGIPVPHFSQGQLEGLASLIALSLRKYISACPFNDGRRPEEKSQSLEISQSPLSGLLRNDIEVGSQ